MKRQRRSIRNRRDNRGSALLVSLMVIVGLSLLGLGFVAISETETAIAKNQQNALQTQAIAESGAKVVVEWFQDPAWAITNAAMPANATCASYGTTPCSPNGTPGVFMKTVRTVTGYTGVYKALTGTRLLDKPYRGQYYDRLFGNEDNADIIINGKTNSTALAAFNTAVLGSDLSPGEISEIRIYAPPIVGGTLTNGFWEGGQRYGVATIKVTAQQYADANRPPSASTKIRASHSVRMVVGEVPVPIPGGPIQSNTAISFGGDFMVHWGNETSTGTLTNKRNPSSIPWANAYERPHFEHGFEPGTSLASIAITDPGSGYLAATASIGLAPAGGTSAVLGVPVVTGGKISSIPITTYGSGYMKVPPLPAAPPAGYTSGTVTWGPVVTISAPPAGGTQATAVAYVGAEVWPITGALYEDANYFNELVEKDYEDPWFGSRAVGDNMADGATTSPNNPQCYAYAFTNTEDSASNASYFFQWQSINAYSKRKVVTFPSIKYDFWKKITSNARGYKGLYYFKNNGANLYLKFGATPALSMVKWANSIGTQNLGPGVFFFDSKTNVNPQGLSTAARVPILAGAESWNSTDYNSSGGPSFLMQGFVYMNASTYGTQGMGSSATTVQANFPGEPYRDIGYPVWCTAAGAPLLSPKCAAVGWSTCTGAICNAGAGDGIFSSQDLNGNGKFDVVTVKASTLTGARTNYYSYDSAASAHANASTYVVKTWKSDAQATRDYGAPCTIPDAATFDGTNPAATDCTEPSEPYLNIVYPTSGGSSCHVGWEAPASQTYRPKILTSATPPAPIVCSGATAKDPDQCTSNAFDLDGGIVPLDVILSGVLYNEGDYDSTGNASYFGSLLVNGTVSGTGTPDIWFDEKLLKGSWAPPGMPRVMVFSVQTDEESGS